MAPKARVNRPQSARVSELPRKSRRVARIPIQQIGHEPARHPPAADAESQAWSVLDVAPMACASFDSHGIITRANAACCRAFGVNPGLLVRQRLADLVSVKDRARLLEHLERLHTAPGPIEAELVVTTRGRRTLRFHLSSHPTPRLAGRTGWLTIAEVEARGERDHAEEDQLRAIEKRWQQERARSQAKDQFLANLSHELRTPLTPALLAISLLPKLEHLTPHGRQMVATIHRSIETEVRLISDLLDVTRIARDKLKLERTNLDVHDVLHESLAVCRGEAESKPVTIELRFEAARSRVTADYVRLKQVFWNLIQNAIKYTPAGGHVLVETANDTAGGVRVRVTDTGVGIEPSELPLLFQPFEQASSTSGGLGLGLSICKGIVDAHGGNIWVSSPGRGSGATFEVRLIGLATQAPTDATHEDAWRTSTHQPLRVLLVEDHADSATMLTIALGTAGHTVQTATTVAEALRRLDEPWDAVISDLGLPDGSGIEIARHCARLPAPPRVRIALSGYGMPADVERSQRAGFHVHLVKPIDPRRLLELLDA